MEAFSKPNKENYTREKIENTPFYIVGNEEKGYFVIMGKYKITEETKTKEETIEKLETEKYNITATIAAIIADTLIKENNQ